MGMFRKRENYEIIFLKELKKDLFDRIRSCFEYKKQVVNEHKKLSDLLSRKIISEEQYQRRLIEILGNKNIDFWIKYYDDYAEDCKKRLIDCDRKLLNEIIKGKAIKFLSWFLVVSFILFIYFGFYFIDYGVDNEPNIPENLEKEGLELSPPPPIN